MRTSRARGSLKFSGLALAALVATAILCLAEEASAVQIKRVIRTTYHFANADQFIEIGGENTDSTSLAFCRALDPSLPGQSTDCVNLPANKQLDLTKSLIQVSYYNAFLGTPDTERIWCVFGDSKTIYCSRYNSGHQADVKIEITEFQDGVNIISGNTTFGKTTCNKTLTLGSSWTVGKAVPFVQTRATRAMSDSEDHQLLMSAELLANNQIKLKRGECGSSGAPADIFYQIVDFANDVTVTAGTTGIAANAGCTPVTATVTPNLSSTTRAALQTTFNANTSGYQNGTYITGKINSTSQVEFQRNDCTNAKNGPLEVLWYAIEFANETYVQNALGTMTAVSSTNATLSAVEDERTFIIHSFRGGGTATQGESDDTKVAYELTTPTNLAFTRGSATGNAYDQFSAIELPPIDLTSPTLGTEAWKIGEQKNITWKHAFHLEDNDGAGADTANTLTIKLSLDGGSNYNLTIASGVDATLDTYPWTIPETISLTNIITNNARIKLETNVSGVGTRVFDASNNSFQIQGTLDLTGPIPGDTWDIGQTTRNITWTVNGDIGNIKILFDTNGASSTFPNTTDLYPAGNLLATVNADSVTTWNWNPIPDAPTSQGRIKLLQATAVGGTSILSSTMTGNFTIRPNMTVVKPTDTDVFIVGRIHTVEWTVNGTVPNFNLLYNPGGAGFGALTGITNPVSGYSGASTTPNYSYTCGVGNKCYDWTLPPSTVQNTNVKVKVEWPADTTVNDTGPDLGDGFFEIKAGVTLDAPTVATIVRVGQNTNVTWSHPGGLGNLRIKYTTNWSGCSSETPQLADTACWITMTTPSSASNLAAGGSGGTYTWNPPDIIGTNVGIRVMEEANPTLVYDQKGAYTVKGKITMLNPAASSYIRVGSTYNITWDAFGTIGNVRILLSKDGGSSYPVTILGPNMYKKVGVGPCNALTVDASLESFLWGSSEHYSDSGCTTAIGAVPNERSTNAMIKVYKDAVGEDDLTSGTAGATSAFKLEGDVQNVRIVEASPYGIGNTVEIQWDPKPSDVNWGTVNLKYSVSGSGGPWTAIDGVATNNVAEPPSTYSNYSWTIPNNANFPSTTVTLKAELASDTTGTFDESAQFQIKGSVILSGDADTGSATPWKIGEQKTISFTKTGAGITNVVIKYSLDGGVDNYPYTIATVTGTSYTWCVGYGSDSLQNYQDCGTPAEPPGTNAHHPNKVISGDRNANIKIKIEVVADPTMNDATSGSSPGTLIIQKQFLNVAVPSPTLEVSDPADSTTFKNITWTTKGISPANILLRYDTGALTYLNNVNSGGAALTDASGYLWQIPDAIGYNTIRVRVKADVPNDAYVYGDSPSAFTVKGRIKNVFPIATDTLIVDNNATLQFAKFGSIGNLKIEYFHNADSTVISGAGATGATSFTWDWSQLSPSGMLNSSSVIDTAGTKNSKFKLTGLTHIGDVNLIAVVETPLFQVRGELYNLKPDNGTGFDGAVFVYNTGTRYLTWKARGNIGNVRIRLDKYSGNGLDGTPGTADDFATLVTGPNATYPNGESVPYNFDGDGAGATCDSSNPCWPWTVPGGSAGETGVNYRIRVDSLDNPATLTNGMATYVTHSSNFWIRGNLSVVSPNGSFTPYWKTGETGKTITFNASAIMGFVDVDVCYDDTSPFTPSDCTTKEVVVNDYNVTSTGNLSVSWNIPSTLTTEHALVRVKWEANATVSDVSDGEFKIKPVLQLNDPEGNADQWVVGTSYNVTWNAPIGNASDLKINFSTNGGKGADGDINTTADNWPDTDCVANLALCQANKGGLIAATVAASALTKSWVIPDVMTNEGVVRISKVGDSEAYDDSNAYFYIKGSIANVQVKNAAANPAPGTPIDLPIDVDQYITWDYTGSLGTVNIYYSTDANAGTPTWTIIPDPDGAGARTSGAGVSIGSGGTGSYQWKIPNAPSPYVKVKVANVSNPSWQDVSQVNPNGQTGAGTYNSIIGSITRVTVVADGTPLTTDMEVTGSRTIQWKPNGSITTFKVEYRKDDSPTWTEITPGAGCGATCYGTSGEYRTWVWTNIPDQISNNIDFKVSDYNDAVKVNCASDGPVCTPGGDTCGAVDCGYVIKGKLSINLTPDGAPDTSPQSIDIRTIGATASPSIQWYKQGTIGDIKIEYSTSGGFTPADVTAGYVFTIETAYPSGANGYVNYAWPAGIITIGGAQRKISDTSKIRVSTVSGPAGTELVSESPVFKIQPSFTALTQPNTSTIWYATNTDTVNQVIRWTTNSGTKKDGSDPACLIQYSIDGSAYTTVPGAGSVSCADGSRTYTWSPMADLKSTTVRVKVSYSDYSSINIETPSPYFTVKPKITVTPTPDANTKLTVAGSYANLIKWTYLGDTTARVVEIRYDTNSGTGGYPAAQTIATDIAANSGSTGVSWNNIPDLIGTGVRVKVFDKNFTVAAGESPDFEIKGGLTLTAPADGTTWYSNVSQPIQWTSTGSYNTVKAYYDLDSSDGLVWIPIVGGTAPRTAGSLAWTPPTTVTNKARVKITNLDDETDVNSANAADFKLSAKFNVSANSENGVSYNAENTTQTINWTVPNGATGIGNIKVYYSNNGTDASPTWIPIIEVVGTALSHTWSVPRLYTDISPTTHKFKITQSVPDNEADAGSAGNPDAIGAGTFPIYGNLTVTVPAGGTSWNSLSTNQIQFTKKGNIKSVDLWYAADGTNFTTKINGAAIVIEDGANGNAARVGGALGPDAGPYFYNWTIPDATPLSAGAVAKIKAVAVDPISQDNAAVSVASAAIEVKGSLTVDTPTAAGIVMTRGGVNYNITWTKGGAITNVKLYYSTNGGGNYLTYPINGGVAVPITPASFSWAVPDNIGNNLVIRIADNNNPNVYDVSDNVFAIVGGLALDQPDGTVTHWYVGDTNLIKWTPTGTFSGTPWPNVEFHYDPDASAGFGGADVAAVSPDGTKTNTAANGLAGASWLVPNAIGSNVKVRVRVIENEEAATPPFTFTMEAVKASVFKIVGKITSITNPAGGATVPPAEVWVPETTHTVKWNAAGTVSPVNLYYKTSAGGLWTLINGTPATVTYTGSEGTYNWLVPQTLKSEDAYIKIEDNRYPNETNLAMTSAFRIRPTIVVDNPISTDKWTVDSPQTIKWTQTKGNAVAAVDIYYSTDGGNTYVPTPITSSFSMGTGVALNQQKSFSWTVPNAIGTNVVVKVQDAAVGYSGVNGLSAAFKIKGGLTLTGPTGGVTKTAATDTDVTWTFSGSIVNVNVYYDADTTNGVVWTLVGTKNQTGCTGSCSYTWTTLNTPAFPSTVGNNYRIKITNAADETDVVSEGADFKIGAQFDITFPENGSPVYAEDVATDITWSTLKGGGINKVHLYYSNSDLSTSAADPTTLGWIRITPAAGVANTSSYNWNPIPRTLTVLSTTAHRVMVTQYDPPNEANVYSIGLGVTFPILGKLIMTTPAGGESWGVNTTQTIKFKKQGDLQQAELYYSYDGTLANYVKIKRADLTTLVDISDATGVPDAQGNYSFAWLLDPATTTLTNGFTGKIKAKAASPSTQTSVESAASNAIEVKGTVTLKAPGGTDDSAPAPMVVGTTYVITWEKFGAVNNVDLHYSTLGCSTGNNFDANPIAVSLASTPSSYNWTVPDKVGTNVCVRIRHTQNTNVTDVSNAVFRIKGKLQLTAPENPGLSYAVGSSQNITWTSTGTFSPVELHYDRDGNFATTADTFSVLPLTTVNNCTPVSPAVTCNGSASFTIEDKITASAKVRIRGTGAESDVSWISTNSFKIVGGLDVTSPENGQVWYVGDTDKIVTWDATGTVTNVNIGYKTSAGAACNYTAITSNNGGHAAGANSFAWTGGVADERSETMYICLQDTNYTEVTNVSAAPFSIRPRITVSNPIAGTRLQVGSSYANLIKFTRTGTKTTAVDIRYSLNGGADGFPPLTQTIASNVDVALGPAGIAWNNIPDPLSNNVLIKVVDPASTSELVFGLSPTFKIVGSLTFSEPVAGTYLNVSGNSLIKWTKTGSFANVNIWYSTDGGINFNSEITPSTSAALLQYSWTNIPATPSNNVVIRVADAADPDTKALSGVVHIHRIYDITQPENGEVLAVGNSYDIKWTVTGGITNTVKLQYATNGGGTSGNWVDIPGATALANATPGTFSWNIPNAISNTVKVRVIDNSDTDNWNESGVQNDSAQGTFKIRPGLTLISPNGNASASLTDKLLVGTIVPIQWGLTGTMATVKLQLSLNGGAYADITGATVLNAASGQTGCTPAPCWNWTIPNNISQQVRVRVVNEADTTVYDPSDYDFAIRGSFTWLYPTTAGTVFKSGETKTLSWTTTGSMPNVNLEYSTNNGSSYSAMLDIGGLPATNIVNSSPFNWPVPTNVVSKDVYLRITGTNDPNSTTTTQKIKIAGILSVSAPAGGARLGASTTQQIKWTTTGPIANIKIEYSLNGGTAWVTPAITDSVAATGQAGCTPAPCFNWLVPTTTSTNVVIRLSDVITDSGTDPLISSVFKIVGSFSFTAPISTTVWTVTSGEIANTTQNIVWATIGGVAQVNIRYSATGSAPWILINTAGAINDGGVGGSYVWTVPDAVGTTVKVLIEDAADPYPYTYNESSPFTIRGDLKVTAPVGGEKWSVSGGIAAAYQTIFWQRNGSIAQVYLDYSKTGSAGPWIAILNATAGLEHTNSGNLAWNVPDDMTTNAFVRVRNVSGPAVEHKSPLAFKIMGRFDMTAPDGGEIATAGQNFNITWNKWGANATNVKIDLATNVNAVQPCSAVAAAAFDKVISANTLNDGIHPWIADVNWITPAACIRIYDVNDIDSENRSANPFVIRASFTFVDPVATTPDLQVGQAFKIIWQKVGNIANVKLEYSPGGNNFTTDIRPIEPTADGIVPNTNAAGCNVSEGCYSWTVPDIEDTKDENIKLRIRDPNDTGAEVISVAFKIIPKLTLTFPNGNTDPNLTDKLKVGHRLGDTATPYTIIWTSSSSQARTPLVVLRYSTDGGGTWPAGKVIANTDNDGSYPWVTVNGGLPDDISSQVKIRVEDASDGVGKDDSDFNVKIISNHKLNAPNGGAVYDVVDPLTITWETIGSAANVELAYSTGGASFTSPVVILASTLNDGSEAWPSGVPNTISSTVRVRVKSTTDDGFDISDADFRIRGKLTVTAPAAAAAVQIGQNYTIQWNATGTIPNVNIRYDTNNGKGADNIAGNADDYPDTNTIATNYANCTPVSPATACAASYNWIGVPDTPTALAKIKIIDSRASESDVIAESAAFNIVGNFTLVAPNGSEDWRVASTQSIKWTWGGTIPIVKLYYTKQLGDPATVTWIEIDPLVTKNYSADGLPQNGANNTVQRSYTWTIPNDISPTVRVKIADASNASVYDVSNNTFAIRGAFSLLTPNGNSVVASTDRWVTNETNRTITWNTSGTIPNVKLEYSNDNFVSDLHEIKASISNTGTYPWIIPDAVLKDINGKYTNYNLVKVRVSDVNDPGVYDTSDYNFKIDYYMITWTVLDLLTNAPLSQLSVLEVKSTDPTFIQWQEVGITTSPPRVQPTPYGSWNATWSKTGYGDMGQIVVADQDRSYTLYMETSTVHIWKAASEFSYDADTDKLDAVSWLERDGSIVPGVVQLDIKFYDGSTLIKTLTSTTVQSSGLILQTWPTTGLQAGKVYAVVTTATIGTGGVFNSPSSLNISEVKKLKDLETTINAKLDTPLSQVRSDVVGAVQTEMAAQTAIIQTQMNQQTAIIQTAINNFNTSVQSSIISLETAAANSLASADKLEDAALLSQDAALDLQEIAKRQAARLLIPPSLTTGEPALLRYRAYAAGLIPLIDILDFNSEPIYQAVPMAPVADKPGLYEFAIDEIDSRIYEPQTSITVIVTESTTGSVESGAIFIETAVGKLLMPRTVLLGDKVIIRFRGRPDWKPKITIQNFEDKKIVDAVGMNKAKDSEDVFEYVITEVDAESYEPGKPATVRIEEAETATVEEGTFLVESTSLTTLEGLVASGSGVKAIASEALDAIKAVEGTLATGGDVSMALESLRIKLDRLPKIIEEEVATSPVASAVNEISEQFRTFAGEEGYDFTTLLEKGLEESSTVSEIREKTDEVQGATEVMQKVIEQSLGGEDAPVVHSFFH